MGGKKHGDICAYSLPREQSLYFDLLSFFILFFQSYQFFQYQRNTPDFKYYVKLFMLPITIAVAKEANFVKQK